MEEGSAELDGAFARIEALDAQTGPVFLVYPSDDEIDAALADAVDKVLK